MKRDSNSALVTIIFVISFLIVCLFVGIALIQFNGTASIGERVSIFSATFALLLTVCLLISAAMVLMLLLINRQNQKRALAVAAARQAHINDCWERATGTYPGDHPSNIIVFPGQRSSRATKTTRHAHH